MSSLIDISYVSDLILLSATSKLYQIHSTVGECLKNLALHVYTILLRLADEIEYIWDKKFTLPTLLYIISRYFSVATEGINFFVNVVPMVSKELLHSFI